MENYITAYKDYLGITCSGSTIDQYSGIVSKYLLKHPEPLKVKYAQVLEFVNSYNSQSSKKQAQGALMHFYKGILNKPELIVRLPKVKKSSPIPDILSEAEAIQIISSIRNIKHRAIIALLYYGALRISEVVNLHINHIDGNNRILHIKFSKGAKSRKVPVPQSTIELLRKYYKIYLPNAFLFKGQTKPRYSPKSIRNILKKALEKNGIKKNVTPHCLRHSRATHLLSNGVDIKVLKDFLGHYKIETTERYLQLETNKMTNLIDLADERISQLAS